MRLRHLIAAAAVLAIVPLGLASTASAGETGDDGHSELDHEAELCIEILEDGGTPEECHEAPSPILPETNEVIWGALSFGVLFALLAKFAWPPIKQGMEGRTERIRKDLDEAESARTDAQGVLDEYKAQLAGAKAESARIIEEARQHADQLRRDQEAKLQADLADMRAKAQTDIEATKSQALTDLQGDVADLAIGAAEVVVERNLDHSTQVQLIENYINQVGQRS